MKCRLSLILSLILTFTLGTVNLFAEEEPRLSPWIGYSAASMSELKDFLTKSATGTVTESAGGIIFGLDIFPYRVSPTLKTVFRAGYFSPLSFKFQGTQPTSEGQFDQEIQTSLAFLGLGAEYSPESKGKMNFDAALFLGPGFGTANRFFGVSPKIIQVPAKGSGVYLEIGAGIKYKISEDFSFLLKLGYRAMKISEMKYTANADIDGDKIIDYKKGDSFLGTEGKPLKFDFSGLVITAGIEF